MTQISTLKVPSPPSPLQLSKASILPVAKSVRGWRSTALFGYSVIALTFGGAGGWAAVAQIDKAVIAEGYIETETSKKTVEHLEGGIVREILVTEGDHVSEGQVLFRLDPIQASASNGALRSQLDYSMALEARLLAERDKASAITWPQEFSGRLSEPSLAKITGDQTRQFQERQASNNSQLRVLKARIDEMNQEIAGIDTQKDSAEKQGGYINAELAGVRELAAKKLVPLTRVYSLERERTRLEGEVGREVADRAKSQSSIGELQAQVQQLTDKFQEEVASSLLEVRQKLAELGEKSKVASDVFARLEITAPRTGVVQNLKVFTLGQVLKGGEPLLDIAPDGEDLVVHARFSTNDIDTVYAGMRTEIRFPAFHSRTVPVILGDIKSISHDRILDEATRQYYYLGVVSLKTTQIPAEYRSRVRAGMPVEAIVSSGERTVLSYLLSPLSGVLRKTFREE